MPPLRPQPRIASPCLHLSKAEFISVCTIQGTPTIHQQCTHLTPFHNSISAEPSAQCPCARSYRDHSIQLPCDQPFFVFPIYHFFKLGAPYSTVLCHLYSFITKTLTHCLLPPPNSKMTSMTLRAQFLLQAPKPCHIFVQKLMVCFPLRISRRDLCNVSTP